MLDPLNDLVLVLHFSFFLLLPSFNIFPLPQGLDGIGKVASRFPGVFLHGIANPLHLIHSFSLMKDELPLMHCSSRTRSTSYSVEEDISKIMLTYNTDYVLYQIKTRQYIRSLNLQKQQSVLPHSLLFIGALLQLFLKKQTMNQPQQYKPPLYLFQRPISPKNSPYHAQSTKNLSITMGGNQSPSNFIQNFKKNELHNNRSFEKLPINQLDRYEKLEAQLKNISKQNNLLRQQNQILRKELNKCKKDDRSQQASKGSQRFASSSPDIDLRETIKKEMGEMKEMKLKLDMLSKQCKIYEEIIEKMDERIKKLTQQSNKKSIIVEELKVETQRLEILKKKVNSIMEMYSDLESKFNNQQIEWMKWKNNWLSEKDEYHKQIENLKREK